MNNQNRMIQRLALRIHTRVFSIRHIINNMVHSRTLIPEHILTNRRRCILSTFDNNRPNFSLTRFSTRAPSFCLVIVAPSTFRRTLNIPTPRITNTMRRNIKVNTRRVERGLFDDRLQTVRVPLNCTLPTSTSFTSGTS